MTSSATTAVFSPSIVRVLTPPAIPPSVALHASVEHAQQALAYQTDPGSVPKSSHQVTHQRLAELHPSQPLVAYLLEQAQSDGSSSSSTNSAHNKVLTVQHTVTRQVVWSLSLLDLAAAVYGETDTKKLPAAAKSLGTVVSLRFFDASTVFWSRIKTVCTEEEAVRWQSLLVQTKLGLFVLNLRQGPHKATVAAAHYAANKKHGGASSRHAHSIPQRLVQAHLHEKTLSATPSSNVLALTDRWLLVGCADGSLKCYDTVAATVMKNIKGLGKGDWIVQLQAANRYSVTVVPNDPSCTDRLRVLTLTKKGIAYLIEVEIHPADNNMEIKPPLARFIGGPAENPDASFENRCFSYDAHRDWILWWTPKSKNTPPVLLVWNLQVLQADLLKQQQAVASKNLFKPDPTLRIQYPTAEALTLCPTCLLPAWQEETLMAVCATATGDLFLQGAVHQAHVNTVTTAVDATPCLGVALSQLLVTCLEDAAQDESPFHCKVWAVQGQALSHQVWVSTQMGLVCLELPSSPPSTWQHARHFHFGAGLGSLGKSVLTCDNASVVYGSLDNVLRPNPMGRLEAKNLVTVYESPPPMHLREDIRKRPFRSAAVFLPSPSGLYVCLFWPSEFKYEILHIATLLSKIGQRGGGSHADSNVAMVASGTAVLDFCWIGDEDVYGILHAPDVMEQAALLVPTTIQESDGGLQLLTPNLKNFANMAGAATKVATSATKAVTSTAANATKTAATTALSATKTVTSTAAHATKAAVGTAASATKAVRSTAKTAVKKGFGNLFRRPGKKGNDGGNGGGDNEDSLMDLTDTDTDTMSSTTSSRPSEAVLQAQLSALTSASANSRNEHLVKRKVELKELVPNSSDSAELGSVAAATSASLGHVEMRGGNRHPPTTLFGGPVLCIASKKDDQDEGHAHFYTRKREESDVRAKAYQSTGPTLPYPDLVTWDEDGRLCAICVANRIAIYLSMEPEFVLLGTVRVGTASRPNDKVTSLKFLHGILYCCTFHAVFLTMLGDLEQGICALDTYTAASTDVWRIPTSAAANRDQDAPQQSQQSQQQQQPVYTTLTPVALSLPLCQPVVLGYQSGSLILSTLRGVQAVPMHPPLFRIGLLLGGAQIDRAIKWFDAVPDVHHEVLGAFLERRGFAELALQLPGLSLETKLDVCMRHGLVEELQDEVETYGVRGLRSIDMGRGVSMSIFGPESNASSVVVSVGAYLLAHGRVELVRRLATECLRLGEEGTKDAFLLGTLMLPVDEADAGRVIRRAMEGGDNAAHGAEWPVGQYVRDYVLTSSNSSSKF